MVRIIYIGFLISIIAFLIGCSGGKSLVTTPEEPITNDSVPIIGGLNYGDGGFQATGVLGMYEMTINPENQTAELSSIRTPSIGESYTVSGKGFFTISPCPTCLKIKSVGLTTDNKLKVTYNISHPFPPGDTLKPPTAMNRLDLDIFDLALIVKPVDVISANYPLTGTSSYPGILANNQGYTRELSSLTGDTAALPYALVIDDSMNTPPSNTWNEFMMGAETDFSIDIDLENLASFGFELYLTMGYGFSATKSQRMIPKYYNPEFNRKSAWKVVVTPPEGNDPPDAGNTWRYGDTTTLHNVKVEVYDWQAGATVYSSPETFADAPSDNIYMASEPSIVSVEIPGMNGSLPSVTDDDGSGTGMPDSPLVYNIPIANQNNLPAGEYFGMVKVTDSRQVLSAGDGRDYLIDSPNGVALINYDIPEYATYQMFTATVAGGCGPITGEILTGCPTEDVANMAKIDFVVTAESANGGSVLLYEVDFDYDGVTFTADDSNIDGVFDGVGPFEVPDPCENNIPYDFTVAFRATDDCDPINVTIFDTCELTVNNCCPSSAGDLSVLSLNRGDGGVDAEQIGSVTFDWDDHPCAVEYAFERADGYTGSGWTLVDVISESEYDWTPSGLDLDNDIRFRVIARAETGGNPATDYDPSEEVFILFMSSMGDMGTTYENNWIFTRKDPTDGIYMTRWYFNVDEWGECGIGFYGNNSINKDTNSWAIAYTPREIPNLDGMKEAYCDGYIGPGANWDPPTLGFCIGTISEHPVPGDICSDFEPANDMLDPSYFPYNNPNCGGINDQFGEVNQDAYRLTPDFSPEWLWHHVGFYLNDLLDPDRNYIAIGYANGDIPLTPGTT